MTRKKKSKPSPDNPHGASFQVGVEHLRGRLALLRGIVPRRAHRKECGSYHFTVEPDGTATVAATDLEVRLLLNLELLGHAGSGTLMLDAHALDALLGGYAEPRLRLHFDEAPTIRVEGLQTKLVLPGHDPKKERKATIEGSLTTSGWIVRGEDLALALRRTKFATDASSTRYALGGVALLFPESEGGPLEIVATDGRRLALARLPVRPHGTEPARVWRPKSDKSDYLPLLSNKATATAFKLATLAEGANVGIACIPAKTKDLEGKVYGDGTIQVVTGDAVLTAAIPSGRFPRYGDVWPTAEPVAELRLDDARRLTVLFETAVAGTDSESKGVEMVLAGGCLMMFTESETRGKATLSLLVPDSEGKATFDVDAALLLSFLRVVDADPIRVTVFGPDQPLMFRSGPAYDFVMMPLTREKPEPKPKAKTEAKPEPESAPEEGPDDGGEAVAPEPEPAPVAPEAAVPETVPANGRARTRRKK